MKNKHGCPEVRKGPIWLFEVHIKMNINFLSLFDW